MKSQDRAKLLLLREKILLDEAPYVVTSVLGGGYDDALNLLVEAVASGSLAANVKPMIFSWTGAVIGPVDPMQTTVSTADLLAWVNVRADSCQSETVVGGFPSTRESGPVPNRVKPAWIKIVRELAITEYDNAEVRGWGTGQESIAKALASICDQEKADGSKYLLTEKGKKLTSAYILRHALSPWDIPAIALANRQNQK